MAIEIPALVPDRLLHPDWGNAAAMSRYQVPAARLLAALDAIPAPLPLMDGLRALAAGGASADLYVAADRGLVQVLIDGRRMALAGAARDAVLTALGQAARAPLERAGSTPGTTPGMPAGGLLDLSTVARSATVDAQVQESRTAAGGAQTLVETVPRRSMTVIPAPLMQEPGSEDAARRLARAVDSSGLFLEAHLAQWLRGERSARQIEDEAHRLPVDVPDGNPALSDHRSASQLDAMQRQAISLAGQAWPGQPFQIEIERDHERHREAANQGDATGLFQATLTLHLPHLGTVRARIRVMESTVGVQVEADHAPAMAARLPLLATALTARGLTLAQLAAAGAGGRR